MGILTVPSNKYSTIQAAIDASCKGDEIHVLPGIYNENLRIINKDGITILSANYRNLPMNNSQVQLTGTNNGDTGLAIESNNITISGLRFYNYNTAINLNGNNNTINYAVVYECALGILIAGNYNKIISSIIESNNVVGIDFQGNYNQLIANRCSYNERGIVSLTGECTGNIITNNIISANVQANIRVSNPNADETVYLENTIDNSTFGILNNFGRVALIANIIINSTDVGVIYKGNGGIVLDNNFINNQVGLYAEGCNGIIAGNSTQQGLGSGIIVTGSKNTIVRNVATKYDNTGLLLTGCNNKICNNQLFKNGIDEVINGAFNNTDCNIEYCGGIGCADYTEYLQVLDIFKRPISSFLINNNKCNC